MTTTMLAYDFVFIAAICGIVAFSVSNDTLWYIILVHGSILALIVVREFLIA